VFPNIWEELERCKTIAKNDQDEIPLAPWCYMPTFVSDIVVAAMTNRAHLITGKPTLADLVDLADMQRQAMMVSIMAAWRLTQGIYWFDETLFKSIIETQPGEIPTEVLFRMPQWGVFIPTPGLKLVGKDELLLGFWAALDDRGKTPPALLMLLHFENGLLPYSFSLNHKTLAEDLKGAIRHTEGFYEELNPGGVRCETLEQLQGIDVNHYERQITPVINLLIYLCSANADIIHHSNPNVSPGNPKLIKIKKGKAKKLSGSPRPPKQTTRWNVGFNIGTVLRAVQSNSQTTSEDGTHASPRAHVRRAHWHHYWTGPKNDPEKRKLIVKWIHPILVNAEKGEVTTTIYPVKGD
jgi:hypothetical protein